MLRGNMLRVCFGVGVLCACIGSAFAAEVPPIFSDGMVLQRDSKVAIWGTGRPGEVVEVTASWGGTATSEVAPSRRWRVELPTAAAGGPFKVDIAGDVTRTIERVWLGEVWFASGQSNMEWKLTQTAPVEDGVEATQGNTLVHFFDVENRIAVHPQAECNGEWFTVSPKHLDRTSAVAFHFAAKLARELEVPIGVITADWGGTPIESWMSAGAASQFAEAARGVEWLEAMRDPNKRVELTSSDPKKWWDNLDDGSWRSFETDEADWESVELPGVFAGKLGNFDGLVYYRRTIELAADWNGKEATLSLGPIDDYDDVWVNGSYVGGEHKANRWNRSRSYTVPARVLRQGENVICIRVLDTGGPGGLHGAAAAMYLQRGNDDDATIALAGEWHARAGKAVSELPDRSTRSQMTPHVPTTLFNGMVAPIAGYGMRGALWYQGESNVGRADEYEKMMPALIANWRSQWETDLSFYYVQIAPYNYRRAIGDSAALRDAQRLALATARTGMAVTLDAGNYADIHPKKKRVVGERLARWALSGDYGREVTPSGPLYRAVQRDGHAMRLSFDHVGSGLELRDSARMPFWIAGDDRKFFVGDAAVVGDDIIVSSPDVPEPVAVRYCWEATPEPSLYNKDGLPASSFRTDTWEELSPAVDNERQVAACRGGDDGLDPIFNGRDLSGWHNVQCAPSTWQVRDGVIVCSGKPTGVLRTDRHYENFILELEYRHMQPGGNAGLFVWSDPVTAKGQPFTRSVEVQVLDGVEGSWYTSQGDIFPIHGATMVPQNGRGGSRAFPTENRTYRAPMWNHYRVVCLDGRISLAVNGKVVTRGERCSPRRGYICLESEGTEIHFRNIRLRELPSSNPPLAADHVADLAGGFVSLYNGVDLSGWKADDEAKRHWQVNDWRLAFDGKGKDLWSERSFGDFVLICDWRWSADAKKTARPLVALDGQSVVDAQGNQKTVEVPDAGDSGIYLRGSSKSQVNIWCWPIGSGEVYGYRTDSKMSAEVRRGVTPQAVADAPIGEWNRFEITMRGDRLTVVLNGKTVIEDAQLPGVQATGPIALQAHGAPIEFANIYIKELHEF